MALVQSITGAGATLVLNSVVAGNWLVVTDTYYRGTSTGVGETTPTDSNGTFLAARADAPKVQASQDVGVSIFYEENAAAGTHTVTPQANTEHLTTLAEFSAMLPSGTLDATVASQTGAGTGTSQSTGTTPVTAQADELSIIVFGMMATTGGSANVGLTDPVANYITLQIGQNDLSSIAMQHAYQILSATGAQSPTFIWSVSDAGQAWIAAIATFKSVSTRGQAISAVRVATKLVGPQVMRFLFRNPTTGILGGVIVPPPGQIVRAVRIANPRVGPQVMRLWVQQPSFQWSVGSVANNFTQALTAALSFSGVFIKATAKFMTAALNFVGAFIKSISKPLVAAALSFVGALILRTNKLTTAALSFIGAQSRVIVKGMTAGLSFIGALLRAVSKGMTAALSFIGAQTRAISKFMAAALSFIGALVGGHLFAKALVAALSFIGGFVSVKLLLKTLTATLAFVGVFTKSTNKSVTAAANFAGVVAKQTAKQMTAAANFVGATVKQAQKLMTAAVNFAGTVAKQAAKFMTAALLFVGVLAGSKLKTLALAAALSFTGTMRRLPNKALSAILAFSGAISTGKRLFGRVWIAVRRAARWTISQR